MQFFSIFVIRLRNNGWSVWKAIGKCIRKKSKGGTDVVFFNEFFILFSFFFRHFVKYELNWFEEFIVYWESIIWIPFSAQWTRRVREEKRKYIYRITKFYRVLLIGLYNKGWFVFVILRVNWSWGRILIEKKFLC